MVKRAGESRDQTGVAAETALACPPDPIPLNFMVVTPMPLVRIRQLIMKLRDTT